MSQAAANSIGHHCSYAWTDRNDEGGVYERNLVHNLRETDAFDSSLAEIPWGHGVSLFDLGQQSGMLEVLRNGSEEEQQETQNYIARLMASALPKEAGRTCRVQLGVQDHPDHPAMQTIDKQPMMLVVWGSDPAKEAAIRSNLKADIELKTERGETVTVGDVHSSRQIASANAAARLYRRKIAHDVVRGVQHEYDLGVPPRLKSNEPDTLYDTISCDLVTLESHGDEQMSLHCDSTTGPNAVVFHSPQRGTSVLLADNEVVSLELPASEGRSTEYTSALKEGDIGSLLSTPSVRHTSASGFGMATQVRPNENDFYNPEEAESTYAKHPPLRLFQSASAQCDHMFRIKTVATAFSPVVRGNGKLAGHFSCSSVTDVLEHTRASATHVTFESTPEWAQALTAHDPQKRPFRYMSESNAVCDEDSGMVTHYRINRNEM